MEPSPIRPRLSLFTLTNLVVGFFAFCIPCAADQTPLEEVLPLLLDTTADCSAMPEIDRALGVDTITWGGHEYLIGNVGNELAIWNIDEEQGPILMTESLFEVGNLGDSDYDLIAFSVCDDCRFGIANYKLGTVLFDLGEGVIPSFSDSELYGDADVVPGGFTFTHEGQQFLVAADLPDECSTTNSSVYAFSGIRTPDLDQVGCIEADVTSKLITGGTYLTDQTQAYAYLANTSFQLLIFEVIGPPESLILDFKTNPPAFLAFPGGFDVDATAGIAVSASVPSGATLWSLADPAQPTVVSTIDTGASTVNQAALRYPRLWLARRSSTGSSLTFDIDDPGNPQPLDQGFWDPSHPWNSHPCTREWAGRFSNSSSVLYVARYSALQAVSFVGLFSNGFESGTTDAWSSTEN